MESIANNSSGAIISECGNYRYQLWRIWDESKPKVMFMMLNPSTADATVDDPTIRRCIGFAKSWGYGGFYVGNLFAKRATKPKELLQPGNQIGEDNLLHLEEMRNKCEKVVAAWGNGQLVKRLLKNTIYNPLSNIDLYAIDLSKDGTPKHPLYLRGDLKPKKFGDKTEMRLN